MRTLQEKYNGIQEGKFSKEHFLAEARMQQPQLITRFNGYDDAVQILKNRGMIQEASKDLLKQAKLSSSEYQTAKKLVGFNSKNYKWDSKEDLYTKLDEAIQEAGGHASINNLSNFHGSTGDKEPEDKEGLEKALKAAEAGNNNRTARNLRVALRRLAEKETVKEARLTKNSLTDYRYKATNEMDKYPYEQILRGIRVELEGLGVQGTPTAEEYSKALVKVSKNLAKDSIFYTNQVAGVNPKVDLHDKMVPVTAKNTVDTFNGMKKATLKEGFKKLIKKVLSESEGDMFGDKERAERSANYGQPGKNEYEFYSDPENYNEEEEEFELQEEDLDESKMGDIYQLAQEHDRFEHFVQAVEKEYGPVDDIAELEHIFNSTRGEDDIDYGDENFSDPIIDSDLYEVRKAKSLSELLK